MRKNFSEILVLVLYRGTCHGKDICTGTISSTGVPVRRTTTAISA